MSTSDHSHEVVDDREGSRLLIELDGEVAELLYERDGDRLILVHAGVPEAIGGRGIAGELVQSALRRAVAEDLTVVPWCPYVRRWLKEHPEAASAVKIDWQYTRGAL